MSSRSDEWFEVHAILKVSAADDEDAINRVTGMLRLGGEVKGVFPVVSYDVRKTTNPTKRPREL